MRSISVAKAFVGLAGTVGLVGTACGGGAVEVAGCGDGAVVTGRALRVATSVAPLTDIIARIAAGTGAIITGIVPDAVDSHTYEPTPRIAAVLEDADVVFLNGLGLEAPTRDLALSNVTDGAELCELGTEILPPEEYLYDRSFPEAGGVPNPHTWTDPPLALEMARLAAEVLSTRDPAHAATYDANLGEFAEQVGRLDAALREATASIEADRRLLLTYHDAYAYFARDYGWTVVGAVQPSTFAEPSPSEVADLVEQIKELGVSAVFGSEVFPSPVLQQIAGESGATYVADLRDDDLPGEPGDPGHSWFELMRINFVTIVEALGGDASALRSLTGS